VEMSYIQFTVHTIHEELLFLELLVNVIRVLNSAGFARLY
jgi:hypothetical protein